jgi:hypothetical protein
VERLGLVELLGAVHREAVRRAAQRAGEHDDLGRIRAEMGMDMLHAPRRAPAHHAAGLQHVHDMPGEGALRSARHPPGQADRPRHAGRATNRQRRRIGQQRDQAALQDIVRVLPLGGVLRIGDLGVPAAQRDALDGHAAALQRGDLAPDEGMAHLRILVDEVRDLHRSLVFNETAPTAGQAAGAELEDAPGLGKPGQDQECRIAPRDRHPGAGESHADPQPL